MERRRAAGALLALAVCIACANAAPTSNDDTALDTYEEGKPEGCYYNFQHYGEGDRIMTNEPCLNCTCHNRMLMCYLRVCPFTKPIGQDCTIEKRADQCCPIITCPDVPVDLLTSTSTTSPAEYGITGVGHLDKYGCSIHGKYYAEGSKVPPTPNKPCEHCYCIRNMTTCVMQECTLHVDGCTPIYHKDVCCPVRYSCDHDEDMPLMLDDKTTTVGTTPGFVWTTTLAPAVTQDCIHGDETFSDGALIKTEKACEHCYCMKGDIVCVVQECGTPMENEGKNCTSLSPREGQCCPDTYICEGDNEITTDESATKPPRRFGEEGYRKDSDEQVPDKPVFISDLEGSGDVEGTSYEPIQTTKEPKVELETQTPATLVTKDKETSEIHTPVPDITLHTSSTGPSDDKFTGFTPAATEQDKVTPIEEEKPTYLPDESQHTTPKYDVSFTSTTEEPFIHDTSLPVIDQDKDITSQTISEFATEEPFKSTSSSLESGIQHEHDKTSSPDKEEPIVPTTQTNVDDNKYEQTTLSDEQVHSQSTTKVDKHDVDSYTTPITDHTIEYATSEIIGEDDIDQQLVSKDHETHPTLTSKKEFEEEFTEEPSDKLSKSPEIDDVKYTLAPTMSPDISEPSKDVTHPLESKDKYATNEPVVTSDRTTPSEEKQDTVEESTSEVSPRDEEKVSTRVTEQEESTISAAIEKSTSSIPTHDEESRVKPVTSSKQEDLIPLEPTTSHSQSLESETSTTSELQDKYDQTTAIGPPHIEDDSLKPTALTEKDEIVSVEPTTGKYFEIDQTTMPHKLAPSDATTKDQIETSTSVITDQKDKMTGDKATVTVEKYYTTPEITVDTDSSSQSTPLPFKETPDDHNIPIIGDDGELFEKTSSHPDKHDLIYDATTVAPTYENEVGDETEMPGKVKPDIDIEKDIFTTPADIDDIATIEPDTTKQYDDKNSPSISVTDQPITKKDYSDSTTKDETVTYEPTVHEGTEKYSVPTSPKDDTETKPAIQQETIPESETKSTLSLLESTTNVPDVKKDDIHTTLPQIDEEASTTIPLAELDSTKYVPDETSKPSQDFETNAAESTTMEVHTESSSMADITTRKPQANQIDNEIIHEFIPTISPSGVIPGEGSCLVEGVTYGNNSIVPSINKCQTACKCMSSIVKCDPIHCSPPPENMINCQPVYDAAESCCPTYVCDQLKVTTPPQPHSQMAITEPTVETECVENCHKEVTAGPKITCNDTQCEVKEEHITPVKQPDLCTADNCALDSYVPATQESDQKATTPDVPCTGTSCNTEQRPGSHVGSEDVTSEMPCTEESCGVDHKIQDTKVSQDCGPSGCKPSEEICNKENGCESVQADTHTELPCTGKSCTTGHKLQEHEAPVVSLGDDCTGGSGCKVTTSTDEIMDQELTTENVAVIDRTSVKPVPETASEEDLYGDKVTTVATFAVDKDKETTVASDEIKHEKQSTDYETAQTSSIAPMISTDSDIEDSSSTEPKDQITYVTEASTKEQSASDETVSQSSQMPSEKVTVSPHSDSTVEQTLDSKATGLPHVDEYTVSPYPDESTEEPQTTKVVKESTEVPAVSETVETHSTSAEISPEKSTDPDIVREHEPTTEISLPSESYVTESQQTSDQVSGSGIEITTQVSYEDQYTSPEKEISEITSHKIEYKITTPPGSQTLSTQIYDSATTQYLTTTEKQRIDEVVVTTTVPIVYEEKTTPQPIHEISTEIYGEISTVYLHTDKTVDEVTEIPKVEHSISPTMSSDENKSSDSVNDVTNKPTEDSQSGVTKIDPQSETDNIHTSTETIDSDKLSTVSQQTSDIIHVTQDKDDKLHTVIPVYDSKKDTTEDQTIQTLTPIILIESTSKYTPELHTDRQKPSLEETTSIKYTVGHDYITESISKTPDTLLTDVTEKPWFVPEDKKTTSVADVSKEEGSFTTSSKIPDIDYHSTTPVDKYPEEYEKHTTEFVTEDKKTTNVADISKEEDNLAISSKTPDIDYHSTTPADKYPEESDKHTTEFVPEGKRTTYVADISKEGSKTPDIDYHSTTPSDKYPEEYEKHTTDFVTEDKKTTNVADILKEDDRLTISSKTPDIEYHSTTPVDKYPEYHDKHTTELATEDKITTNVADISKEEENLSISSKTPDIDYHSTTPADKYPEEYDKHTTEFVPDDKKTTNVADISKEEDNLAISSKTPDIDYHSTTPADKYEEYDKHTTEFVAEDKKTTIVADISKEGSKTPDVDYHITTPADKYPEEYDKHTTEFVTEDKKTTNVGDISKEGSRTPDIDYHSTTPADKYPKDYDQLTTEFVTEDKITTNVADISQEEDNLTTSSKTPHIDYHSTTPADKYPEESDKHTTEFVPEGKRTTYVADISKESSKTPDIDYHSTTPSDKYPEEYDKHTTEFVTEDKKTTNVADISKEEDNLAISSKTPHIDYHSTTPADKYPDESDKHTTEFVPEGKRTTHVADISKEGSKTPDIDYHSTTPSDKYPEEYDKHTTEFVTEDKKTTHVADISKEEDSFTVSSKTPDIDYHSSTLADKYPEEYDKHTTEFVTKDKETTNIADISRDEERLTTSSKSPDIDYHSTTPVDKYPEEYDKHTTEVQSSTQKQEPYSPVGSSAMEPQSTTLKESGETDGHTSDLSHSSEQTTEHKISEDYATTSIKDTETGVGSYDYTTRGLESDTTHEIYTESPIVSKAQPTPEIEVQITTLSSVDKELAAVSDGISTKSDFEEHTSVPENILTKETEIPHEQTVVPLEPTTVMPAHVTSHVMSTVEDIRHETTDYHVDLDQAQISKSTPKEIEEDVTTAAAQHTTTTQIYDHETVSVSQEELTTTTHKPLIEKETDLKDTTIKPVTDEGHVEDYTHIPDHGAHVDVTPSTDHKESPVPTIQEGLISVTEKQTTDQMPETPGSIIDLESPEMPIITTSSTEEELHKHPTTVASPIVHDKEHESTEEPQSVTELSTPDRIKPVQSINTTIQPEKPSVTDKPVPDDLSQPDDVTEHQSSEQIPPSGTGASGYGQEPDYDDDEQPFGPGTCRYGGKVYVSAQQIPRDDPCDFCFCFRSDIICLQQSCPPPIHGCHEEPIQGFCCPRYECPVSMGTSVNMTTTTTTTTTTLPPHFLPHAYKGAAQRKGCQIKGHSYDVGEVVRASSGPCLHCTCGGDGQMKCDPKVCTPEPMLRQMIAAAVSSKRRR